MSLPEYSVLNYSHTFCTNLDCGLKTYFYLTKAHVPGGNRIAMDRGIRLHEYCDDFLKDKEVCLDNPDHEDTFDKILPFLEKLKPNLREAELEVIRTQDAFRAKGRMDAVDKNGVGYDWKFPGKGWDANKFLWYVEKQGYLYLWLLEQYLAQFDQKPTRLDFIVVPTIGQLSEWQLVYNEEKVQAGLQLWKAQMLTVKSQIEFDNFQADPTVWKCRFCNFKTICSEKVS